MTIDKTNMLPGGGQGSRVDERIPHPDLPPPLLSENEAARFLRVKPETLRSWRMQAKGPKFVRVGDRYIRYQIESLMAFVAENTRG